MVKVDLITGFLGSGKTTFLLKYARYLMNQGLKIGILEYDYGAVNIDMLLLSKLRGPKCELEMLAAACDEDCLKRRFKTKLIAMAMSGYDRVIIEPSGVFDMDQFYDTLRDEPLENWYEIGNVITVVNAMSADESDEANFWLASQAACAGKVVLSRTQLATREQIEMTKTHLEDAAGAIQCKNFNPDYVEKNWDNFSDDDYKDLLNCGYHIGNYVKVVAGTDTGFESVSSLKVKDNLEGIKKKIEELYSNDEYGNIFRIKGFVIDQGGSYQVNATKNATMVDPISIGQSTAIVIGTNLDKVKILEVLER